MSEYNIANPQPWREQAEGQGYQAVIAKLQTHFGFILAYGALQEEGEMAVPSIPNLLGVFWVLGIMASAHATDMNTSQSRSKIS